MMQEIDQAWLDEWLAAPDGKARLLACFLDMAQQRDDALALAKAAAKGGAMAELNEVAEGHMLRIERFEGLWQAEADDSLSPRCPTAGEALAALVERMGDGE